MTAPLIMIVDDDADLREMLSLIIGAQGFETVGAVDGRDAIDMLERGMQPSLILLDLRMPRMNGSEFLRAVRGTQASGIPIVTLTGDPNAAQEVVLAGAISCLRKPIEPRALMDAIRTYVGSQSSQPAVPA